MRKMPNSPPESGSRERERVDVLSYGDASSVVARCFSPRWEVVVRSERGLKHRATSKPPAAFVHSLTLAATQRSLGSAVRAGLVACGFVLAGFNPAFGQPAAPDTSGREVVARVGEHAITLDDLRVLAVQNGYDLSKPSEVTLALRDATNQEVLAAEARRRGYENDPEIRRFVRSQIVQRLVRESVDTKAAVVTPPAEAELRAYYDKNLAEFTPPTVAQAQILALLRRTGDEKTFPTRLAEVRTAIADPKTPFADVVKRFSDDPGAQTYGGITNWLVKGEANKQYPTALLDAVFAATDDKAIAGPITHNNWVYFVRLKERRDGKPSTFEQSKEAIARNLLRRKRLETYDAFVRSLATSADVKSDPEKVSALIQATARPSGPPAGPVRPRP